MYMQENPTMITLVPVAILAKRKMLPQSKRRRLLDASPAEQFAALRKLHEVTPATCRKVISLLREDGKGSKVCHRQKNSHVHSYPCLRHLQVPALTDGKVVNVPCMSLPALIEAKVKACGLYKAMLRAACQAHNAELTLIFYTDEVTGEMSSALRKRERPI